METKTNETTEPKKTRTITLTGRRPVRIIEEDWPIVARGKYRDWDTEHECQANRTTDLRIVVRQHADGRAVVYGVYLYDTTYANARNVEVKIGHLIPAGGSLPDAIREVAGDLSSHDEIDGEIIREVTARCMADLPAEEI